MQDTRLELAKQRNLGEIISDAFSFQGPNWRTLAAAAGPAVLVAIILQLLVFAFTPETPVNAEEGLTDAQLRDLYILAGIMVLSIPIAWVIYVLSTAGVVVVIKGIGEGRVVAAGEALDAAQDRMKDLLLTSLKSIVFVFLLMVSIVGIPWAIRRAVLWLFYTQAIMVDGATHRDALDKSAELVKGRWWLTVGRTLVITIMVGFASSLVGGLFTAIVPGVPGILLSGALGFLTVPYTIVTNTLIFYDYRTRMLAQPA